MEKTQTPVVGSIILATVLMAGAAMVMQRHHGHVTFCQGLLRGLIHGQQSVSSQIDWAHLKALGFDVGAHYTALPNDQERTKYRQAFVVGFANGFSQVGGRPTIFSRWRVLSHEDGRIVVAAHYEAKHKTLLMTLPASGKPQLEALQWQ